ncbi:type II toxin-antitoxin system VapB family antitoxin [Bradyrhizobium sp. 145]|uniref:type II toxin-antitoxin system VapB family antitoxin n=1 Tax=Bradyrhizobium sp. 145 TaxID=2782621 RepID=UPI001FFB70B4|nr:type II toxin-antitoxin system VapB family antitoxin [Bradyrhizobium sp. 145]
MRSTGARHGLPHQNPETDALARKVASLKKLGLTEAVHVALAHELEREQGKPSLVRAWRPVLPGSTREGRLRQGTARRQGVPRQFV